MASSQCNSAKDSEEQEDVIAAGENQKDERKSNDDGDREEEEAIEWEDDGAEDEEARLELSLAGKIWTNRHVNANAFITTMTNVWNPKHGVEISSLGRNLFMCQFHHWKDKQHVLNEQPWHFDRHVIIFREIEDNIKPTDIEFFELPMWIRVYNLPLIGRLNLMNVEKIGNKLEEYFDVKYEKPPLYCFHCGKIGHGIKDYDVCRDVEEPVNNYGAWLKASPWKKRKTNQTPMERTEEKRCAKPLFVTKPKDRSGDSKQINHMDDMLNKLEGCDIKGKNDMSMQGKEKPTQEEGEVDSRNEEDASSETTGRNTRRRKLGNELAESPFTWTNNRGGENNVQERLDRCLANPAWRAIFPGALVMHLCKRKSDHLPILLCIKNNIRPPKKRKKKRLFRFEEMWLREETCADIINKA
ncbi:Translation factor Guf1 mitochondrial [Bienertia sinuspersici]